VIAKVSLQFRKTLYNVWRRMLAPFIVAFGASKSNFSEIKLVIKNEYAPCSHSCKFLQGSKLHLLIFLICR